MIKLKKTDFKKALEEYKQTPQKRGFLIERAEEDETINQEARTVWIAFSSEEPYLRWFGNEILGHEKGEVDLSRMVGAALLVGHNWDDQVGVVEEVRIDADRRGRALVRFGKSQRAEEIFNDVVDGIRRQVSVGYQVKELKLTKESEEGPDEYRVTDWQPYEVSLVSVAADFSVGVGRQVEEAHAKIEQVDLLIKQEKSEMSDPVIEKEKTPTVDVEAERNAAVTESQNRVNEILACGEKFQQVGMAMEFVKDPSKTVEDFHLAVLEKTKGPAIKAEEPEIGLDDKQINNFSFVKLLNAMANPSDLAAQRAASFELECSREAAKKAKKDGKAFTIPHEVLTEKRDFTVGTRALTSGGSAGNLIAENLLSASFIDLLVNMTALQRCGATVLDGLSGNIAIPRQIGGATVAWIAEGDDGTLSDATFDQLTMSPHTIIAASEFTRRTLLQSSIGIENFVRMDLARSMALGLDIAGIKGSGVGEEPLGILNQTGIGNSAVGGANGGVPTWSHIVKMETDVGDANADFGSLCYLTNAKVRGKLKETEKFAGGGREIWGEGNTLNGYRAEVSNQVPGDLVKGSSGATLSAAIYGNFADVLIGLWGGLDVIVDPYTKALSGGTRIIAMQDADVNLRRTESFSVFNDIITV